jgi:hypothetical protein
MEALAIIGLVGNIVQFVDFIGKLIEKSAQLYHSSEGALAENIDTATATSHLVSLNDKLKKDAGITRDEALGNLCKSCNDVADELLAVLDKFKVKWKHQKLESVGREGDTECVEQGQNSRVGATAGKI